MLTISTKDKEEMEREREEKQREKEGQMRVKKERRDMDEIWQKRRKKTNKTETKL